MALSVFPEQKLRALNSRSPSSTGKMFKSGSSKRVAAALLLLQLVGCMYTAQAALYSGDSPVRLMNESDFRSEVLNSNDMYLVEFFADWCGHCQQFAPAFESVAKSLRGIVTAVALREERGLMQEFDVKGFPTVMVVVGKGGAKPKTFRFEGQRDAATLLDFVLTHVGKLARARLQGKIDAGKNKPKAGSGGTQKKTGPSDVIVLTDATFDHTVMKDEDAVWFVEFYAPWCGHCKALAPLWEEVATSLKGKVKVAKVDATTETALASRFSIQGFPTIKLFPAGSKSDSMVQDYNGPRLASAMVEFAMGFYRVCAFSTSVTAEQLLSEEAFRSECADGLCIVAFLPHELDSGVEGRLTYLRTLNDVAKANATVPAKFFWLQGGDNFDVEDSLQLAFGWPAVVALHLTKGKFSTHRGDFSKESISLFLQQLLAGRAPVRDLPKLKPLKKTEKWIAREAKDKKVKEEL